LRTAHMALVAAIVLSSILGLGCAPEGDASQVDNLTLAREAISSQDYAQASRHAALALRAESGNREAKILATYIEF